MLLITGKCQLWLLVWSYYVRWSVSYVCVVSTLFGSLAAVLQFVVERRYVSLRCCHRNSVCRLSVTLVHATHNLTYRQYFCIWDFHLLWCQNLWRLIVGFCPVPVQTDPPYNNHTLSVYTWTLHCRCTVRPSIEQHTQFLVIGQPLVHSVL